MNTADQESLKKVGKGTLLEILKNSVKSNLNLGDRMSKMLRILYSKPQDYTYSFWPLQDSAQRGMTSVRQSYTILS